MRVWTSWLLIFNTRGIVSQKDEGMKKYINGLSRGNFLDTAWIVKNGPTLITISNSSELFFIVDGHVRTAQKEETYEITNHLSSGSSGDHTSYLQRYPLSTSLPIDPTQKGSTYLCRASSLALVFLVWKVHHLPFDYCSTERQISKICSPTI